MTHPLDRFAAEHREMERLFAAHQIALMGLDVAEATATLDRFEAVLHRHMRIEEEVLLTLHREHVTPKAGGGPELYEAEHRKILEQLRDIRVKLGAVGSDAQRALELLDTEWIFKNLMHHHDQREQEGLYPELKAAVPEEELAKRLAV